MKYPLHPRQRTRFPGAGAFSLIELMVVLTIIGVIITLSVSMFSGVLEANSISRSSHMVVDHISQGRQIAAARNVPIEVRFVLQPAQLPPSTPSVAGIYNAVQLWETDPQGGPSQPVSKLEALPSGYAVLTGASAPYLSPPLVPTANPPPLSGTLEFAGKSLNYVGFEIRPTGLIPSMLDHGLKNTFVTVAALRHSDSSVSDLSGADRKVNNYAIVQINPLTGSATVYQP